MTPRRRPAAPPLPCAPWTTQVQFVRFEWRPDQKKAKVLRVRSLPPPATGLTTLCHVCGWIERIPGGGNPAK